MVLTNDDVGVFSMWVLFAKSTIVWNASTIHPSIITIVFTKTQDDPFWPNPWPCIPGLKNLGNGDSYLSLYFAALVDLWSRHPPEYSTDNMNFISWKSISKHTFCFKKTKRMQSTQVSSAISVHLWPKKIKNKFIELCNNPSSIKLKTSSPYIQKSQC